MAARQQISESRLIAGAASLIAAAASAELAWIHMRPVAALGEICGQAPSPHCGWCAATVGFLGLAGFIFRPRRVLARA